MKRTNKNIIYSLLGTIIPLALTIITVPILLREIGETRFGVLSLTWIIIGYLVILDLGVSKALIRKMSTMDNHLDKSNIVKSCYVFNLKLGTLVATACYAATFIFVDTTTISIDKITEDISLGTLAITLIIPFAVANSALTAAHEGFGKFKELSIIQIISSTSAQIGPLLCATLYSKHLNSLLISISITQAAVYALTYFSIKRTIDIKFSTKTVPIRNYEILSFGLWTMASSAIPPIMESADKIIVSRISGISALPSYSIPYSAITRIRLLPSAFCRALYPELSSLEHLDAIKLAKKSMYKLNFLMLLILCPTIPVLPNLMTLWLGNSPLTDRAIPISQVIALAMLVNSLSWIPSTYLTASGRPKLVALVQIAQVLPFLLILYLFTSAWGAFGAALALLARSTIDALIYTHLTKIGRGSAALTVCVAIIYLVPMIHRI